MPKRVVTGLNGAGKSCVVVEQALDLSTTGIAWLVDQLPADNSGTADTARPVTLAELQSGLASFSLGSLPAGASYPFHATDTIDFITMISGAMALVTESGETLLEPGDLCIDRGVMHGWRTVGAEPAVYSVVMLPAHAVGGGRTV